MGRFSMLTMGGLFIALVTLDITNETERYQIFMLSEVAGVIISRKYNAITMFT